MPDHLQFKENVFFCLFVCQHAAVSGEFEKKSKERPDDRERCVPAALPADRHAPLQGQNSFLRINNCASIEPIIVVRKKKICLMETYKFFKNS